MMNFPFISFDRVIIHGISNERVDILDYCELKILQINKLLVCNNDLRDEAVIGIRFNDFFVERATILSAGETRAISTLENCTIDNRTNNNNLLLYTEYASQSIDVLLNVTYLNNVMEKTNDNFNTTKN